MKTFYFKDNTPVERRAINDKVVFNYRIGFIFFIGQEKFKAKFGNDILEFFNDGRMWDFQKEPVCYFLNGEEKNDHSRPNHDQKTS